MYKESYKKNLYSNVIYVKQSAELVTEDNPVFKIEQAGRTCYQSGSTGDPEKAAGFVQRALKMKHLSIFEHAVFCFVFPKYSGSAYYAGQLERSETNPDFEYTYNGVHDILSINFRYLMEAYEKNENLAPLIVVVQSHYPELFLPDDLIDPVTYQSEISAIRLYTAEKFRQTFDDDLTPQEKLAHYYFSFVLQTDRGVMAELTRHRRNAFSVSSTRYINFDKKIGRMPVVEPKGGFKFPEATDLYLDEIAQNYSKLLKNGLTAQEARAILPQCLWTEIFTTANLKQWCHVFELRLAPAAHPMIRELMTEVANLMPAYLEVTTPSQDED